MSAPIYDPSVLMESLGGDESLYDEIVGIFVAHHRTEIDNLRRELAASNAATLQRAAHSIKGSVSNFGAERATEAARVLEHTMKEGLAPNATELVNEVVAAVEELVAALQAPKG